MGDADHLPGVGGLIRKHGLNGLVAAGALGLGHIRPAAFIGCGAPSPMGAWFAVSLHERLVEPGASDFGDYLAELERRNDWGEIVLRERFRHRLTMAGDPIHYMALVARRGPGRSARS